MTKAQIDKLGDRLRSGQVSADDLRALDDYRNSFVESLQDVMSILQNRLKLEVTGRGKTTPSISDKLRRESIRLSQMQDVAGCRVVCPDLWVQEIVLSGIQALFDMTQVMDRRERPSHGYRAVHVIGRDSEAC